MEEKITIDEYELSILKHYCWEQLNNFINEQIEENNEEPEFADFWKKEFYDCKTTFELLKFIKDFQVKKQMNTH